jgi:hypothetical protein
MPFIFNLQTMSTMYCRCRTSQSRPGIIGCGQEVAERAPKATTVLETKQKDEPTMKILDDLKIPTARRIPRWPHHSHKILDVTAKMAQKPRRLYWRRCRHHHIWALPHQTFTLKLEKGYIPPTRGEIHPYSMAWRTQNWGKLMVPMVGR